MKITSKWRQPQKWNHLKNEDNLKNEDDLKNEDNLKNEDYLKNKDDHIFFPPPLHLNNYLTFLMMTSYRDNQTTADVKAEMIPGIHMEVHMVNMIYTVLPMHTQTEKTIF